MSAPNTPLRPVVQPRPKAPDLLHPASNDFTRGVEVTEVMDSLPGELLDLFQPKPPTA